MAVTPISAFYGLLMAALVTGQHVEITPKEAVRRVGDELTVLCKVSYPLDSCRMTIGTDTYRVDPNTPDAYLSYYGQGLKTGECGVRLKRVEENLNGNISCTLPPPNGFKEVTASMRLIVARAPEDPNLITPNEQVFIEGNLLMAQCVVARGRPAANITWFMENDTISEGLHQPVITKEPGTDLETISQNITRTLLAEDGGKRLRCVPGHPALTQPKPASRQLIIHYPPKRLESGTITIFGLKLGSEGRLNVTVRAAPAPHAEWSVAEHRLAAPQNTDDGQLTALQPLHLGGGYYNVTLILARVSKEDVDRTYYLRVHNDLGTEEFNVRISTMDEPASVELETGAIVGIVIGVLVLLIAISLIVFAKATDRWCFGGRGRGRDHTRNSGESSDTESAVGGRERSRLSALTARVRAALPRAKDKVQATDPPTATDEQPLSEEKKAVVYAELVLSEQPSAEKPAPPSTEYAEIVYTEQSQQREAKE